MIIKLNKDYKLESVVLKCFDLRFFSKNKEVIVDRENVSTALPDQLIDHTFSHFFVQN